MVPLPCFSVPSQTADPVRVAIVLSPLVVVRLRFVPGASERNLFSSEPEAEDAPKGRQRSGDEANAGQPEAQPGQQRIGPGPDLVASAIHKRVNEALGFVFVLAS